MLTSTCFRITPATLDPRVAQDTLVYLLKHPTWPTEWSLHMPMMAAADYEATGDLNSRRPTLIRSRKSCFQDKARADGFVERDGHRGLAAV